MRTALLTFCILLAPLPALAQAPALQNKPAPAELLPAESLFYLHFDGIQPHQKAFAKTILGQLLKEDFGQLIQGISKAYEDMIELAISEARESAKEKDAGAIKPVGNNKELAALKEEAAKRIAELREQKKLLRGIDTLWANGLALTVEWKNPTDFQFTYVLPDGAKKENWEHVHRLLKALAADGNIKTSKVLGRTVHQKKPAEDVDNLAWWKEGDHVVCVSGTRPASKTLQRIDQQKPNLTSTALYQKVARFDQYENCCHGFADLKKVIDLFVNYSESDDKLARAAEAIFKRAAVNQLGLGGVDSLTWHCGFEGKYLRSTVKLHIPDAAERKGLLKLISAPIPASFKGLPALPDDADWVSVHHVDWLTIFDTCTQMYQSMDLALRVQNGNLLMPVLPDLAKSLKDELGADSFDVRQELLAALDSTVVLYSAYSDGPSVLGHSAAVKIKDAAKLNVTLDRMAKLLQRPKNELALTRIEKFKYRGANITSWHFDSLPVQPSYVMHDGWLVVSLFPQAIKAHVWRVDNPKSAWQAPALVETAVKAGLQDGPAQTKLAALTVTDPRRSLELLMPLAPVFWRIIGADLGHGQQTFFNVSSLPHTKAITSKLSPNVTALFDDGNAWRWETHSTAELPSVTSYAALMMLADGLPTLQRWQPQHGLTLPSPHYLEHPPQYVPAPAGFPLPKELEKLEKGSAPGKNPTGVPGPLPVVPAPLNLQPVPQCP